MFKYFVRGLVIVSLLMQSACGTLNKDANAKVNPVEVEKTPNQSQQVNNLKVDSVIYTEQALPLAEFHKQLLHGRFKDAFSKIDLRYRPSNTENEILTELMDDGFIPVFVRLQNVGSTPIDISEKDFAISSGKSSHTAFLAPEVPSKFERVNGAAIAGDVALATLLLVGFFATMYVPNSFLSNAHSSSFSMDNWTKTTHLTYGNFLIYPQTLLPGSVAEGLLFFERTATEDNRDFQLVYSHKL